jgi:hypothetical protein
MKFQHPFQLEKLYFLTPQGRIHANKDVIGESHMLIQDFVLNKHQDQYLSREYTYGKGSA